MSYREVQMPVTKLSTKGQVVIPKQVREAAGVTSGTEFDVESDNGVIILRPKRAPSQFFQPITTAELVARRIKWNGPTISEEDIKRASADRAVKRYLRSME
jgi:AbrB family looped-hinge helix DNA binding protein